MRNQLTCLLIISILTFSKGWAWNQTGHKVITAIAWDNLSKKARNNIISILKQAPDDSDLKKLFDPSQKNAEKIWFMSASYWPDIVRNRKEKERYEKYHKGSWHYIGRFWKQTAQGAIDVPELQTEVPNSVERIQTFNETLRNPSISDSEKAIQIAWLLHLVGDVHMPLHNASRVTEKDPKGDRGGNNFKLQKDKWPYNLHAYWDGILDIQHELEYGKVEVKDYYRLAKKITKANPRKKLKSKIKVSNPEAWSEKGYEIVKVGVYPNYLKENELPGAKYQAYAYNLAATQIALAGYRMAEMLNSIFG